MKLNIFLFFLFFLIGCSDNRKPVDLKKFLLSSKYNNREMHFITPIINSFIEKAQIEKNSTYYTKYNPELTIKVDGKDLYIAKSKEYYKIYIEENILYSEICQDEYKNNENNYICNDKTIILSNTPWEIIDRDSVSTTKCKITRIYEEDILNEKHHMLKIVCTLLYNGSPIDNNTYVIFADTLGVVETGISNSKDITKLKIIK